MKNYRNYKNVFLAVVRTIVLVYFIKKGFQFSWHKTHVLLVERICLMILSLQSHLILFVFYTYGNSLMIPCWVYFEMYFESSCKYGMAILVYASIWFL